MRGRACGRVQIAGWLVAEQQRLAADESASDGRPLLLAPVEIANLVEATFAREHRLFAGKLDKSTLNFGERAILRAVRAPEGDFRPWEDITAWAETIADVLERRPVPIS